MTQVQLKNTSKKQSKRVIATQLKSDMLYNLTLDKILNERLSEKLDSTR